jgi:peptidoglycan endopeptidase LytE
VVVKGDTLGGIARKYGTTVAAVKQANAMTSDTVVLGKKLKIPGN